MLTVRAVWLVAAALVLLTPAGANAWHAPWRTRPRIAVVWPQDGRGNPTSVESSRAVNVSAWPSDAVSCTDPPDKNGLENTRLLVAKDNEPTDFFAGDYQVVQRSVGGSTFPTLEFANVPADLAAEPNARYRFVLFTIGTAVYARGFSSNVWSHAADSRTILPQPLVPDGYSADVPREGRDARIQIVWPHDAQGRPAPVDRAPFVNVAVDIFRHGMRQSMPLDTQMSPVLFWQEGNGPLDQAPPPAGNFQRADYAVGGRTYPRWVFNDVPVRPGAQYHFVAGATFPGAKYTDSYATIWTHAPDARTFLPDPEPPPPCVP